MASTYTTGFGIEKIGSGEQAGAWGTTTNHNADILDRIASYKAVALSGTTHTLTVREASPGSGTENLQDGMYRVIKFTGALGANNTVTIAPNTSPAWFIIENATTDSGSGGPYSVILTQGSGANVTVQNGKNAIIYCDGAGAGAVVYDALADLQVGTISGSAATVTSLTADGTVNFAGATVADGGAVTTVDINGGTIDGAVIGGATAAAGSFTDINLTSFNNASSGPYILLTHDSVSPDPSDEAGEIVFRGRNDANPPVIKNYAQIKAFSADVTAGSEDGLLYLVSTTSGVEHANLQVANGGVTLAHLGATKLVTSATGVGITGNLGIDQASPTATLDVNGSLRLGGEYPVGTYNNAIGSLALGSLTTGNSNVAVGRNALYSTTKGSHNTAVGYAALYSNIGTTFTESPALGTSNTALGHNALYYNTTGVSNTATGQQALYFNTAGDKNTATGRSSLYHSSGSYNTAIGYYAGLGLVSGDNNTLIGYYAVASTTTVSNQITLGNASVASLRCQVTSITALSDMRDKTDVVDLPFGLDYINALRPVEFVWNIRGASEDNPRQGTKEAGFIAQELQATEWRFGAEWLGTVMDDNPDRLEATPGKLLPIVIKALQEASAKIEALEARITSLEGK